MDSPTLSVVKAEKRLLTVTQQIEELKAWNKLQENQLRQKMLTSDFAGKNRSNKSSERRKEKAKCKPKSLFENIKNVLEEEPIIPGHKDFQSLLNAKLADQNCDIVPPVEVSNVIEKRPFLRKGEGLSRFRMKPEDFNLKKRNATSTVHPKVKAKSMVNDEYVTKNNTPLEAFELLEQQTNDSSFSSSSSMVVQLMEDSIKSTPIKVNDVRNDENFTCNSSNVCGEYDFFGVRKLDVIDEEPSKFENSSRNISLHQGLAENENCKLVILNVSNDKNNENFEDDLNDTDCSSTCSCCQDDSRYTAKSLSVFTEKTTTVYSPAKKEYIHETQFYEAAEESNSHNNESDSNLKSLLQSRLRELETEIDAFRTENIHLTKLRENYETEYNKFREEKMQLLAKIRAEHLLGVQEIEEEKKLLQREKTAFEKYVKEMKTKPNKQEKEEIRLLKEEIKLLKEEFNKKESRWAAAQARIRTEMKQLKDLNTTLKEELKEFKAKKVSFVVPTRKLASSSKRFDNINTSQPPNLDTETVGSTNDLLQHLKFSDTKYIDRVRSLTNNSALSSTVETKSVCVRSYLDNVQLETKSCDDANYNAVHEVSESHDEHGNVEKSYPDGRKEIWFPNGNVKKISSDGKVTKTIYYNGDIKEVLDNEVVKYFYAKNKVWHSEYADGLKILEFSDGQVEKHFKDGSSEIIYPNGTVYEMNSEGEEKWKHSDGTVIVKNKTSNEKRVSFPNGEVEIHTPEYKKREYPNGTVKFIYIDGTQETRYWNGRIRLKTKDGELISDTEVT